MSLTISNAVWKSFHGKPFQKLVMLCLADIANEKAGTGVVYQSGALIAQKTGISHRQVRRVLADLIDDGWLFVTRDANEKELGSPREYRIALERLDTPPSVAQDKMSPRGGIASPQGEDKASSVNRKGTGNENPSVRFEEFWSSWPNTERRVAKKTCRAKWQAENLDAVADVILAHVAALKSSDQWQRGFQPAPLKYLDERRWEDGPPPPKKKDMSWLV